MAILEGIFGPISGRLGDCVFRNRGGKTIIAALPRKRSSPKNAAEIENEKKFGLTGKIAKSINSVEIIKQFWQPTARKNQSCYQAIFKKNYGWLNVENLGGHTFLTPDFGFNLTNPAIYPAKTNVLIECEVLGDHSKFDTSVEKYVAAAGIIVFKDPLTEGAPMYESLGFKSNNYLLYPSEYLCLSVKLTQEQLLKFERYSIKRVFAVFVTLDESGRAIQYSEIFCSK